MAMYSEDDIQYALEETKVIYEPDRRIDTFGDTRFSFLLLSELMDETGTTRIRSGWVEAEKPKIISRIKALRNEALVASGYDKERVRELIMRRLAGIVSTHVTDIVHISPGRDDPNRDDVLNELAEANGGQTVLDFGDMLIVPTTCMTEEMSGSIKKIKAIPPTEHSNGGIEVEMNDVIAAAKLLAEISGVKEADTSVSVNVSPSVILQQAEARRRASVASVDYEGGPEQKILRMTEQ